MYLGSTRAGLQIRRTPRMAFIWKRSCLCMGLAPNTPPMGTPHALLRRGNGSKPAAFRPEKPSRPMTTAHDFSFAKLDEPGEIKLKDYAGKAILVVNVASACGFTPQYRDLEALYEAKAGKGLVIVGVPCNDFGHQESGSARDIREFCDTSYHVTFPMTGKVEIVSGAKRHPFYQWIADELGETSLP